MDKLSPKWKFNFFDKIKWEFLQVLTVSVLLYGWTTWTWMKYQEKKLDWNNTRILHAVLNKSSQQHPEKKQLLYSHLAPISQTIQVRWVRHAGEVRTNYQRKFFYRLQDIGALVLAEQQKLVFMLTLYAV